MRQCCTGAERIKHRQGDSYFCPLNLLAAAALGWMKKSKYGILQTSFLVWNSFKKFIHCYSRLMELHVHSWWYDTDENREHDSCWKEGLLSMTVCKETNCSETKLVNGWMMVVVLCTMLNKCRWCCSLSFLGNCNLVGYNEFTSFDPYSKKYYTIIDYQ